MREHGPWVPYSRRSWKDRRTRPTIGGTSPWRTSTPAASPGARPRRVLWRTLVDACFQRYVGPTDTVLDLGAGYCEFINPVRCGAKHAVDLNPALASWPPRT